MWRRKYYAVKVGRVPGIYTNFVDCKYQVSGFPGSEYACFTQVSEAREYMGELMDQIDMEWFEIERMEREMAVKKLLKQEKRLETERLKREIQEKQLLDCISRGVFEDGIVAIYLAGKCNQAKDTFSYGMVVLERGQYYQYSRKKKVKELIGWDDIGGELLGAETVLNYAMERHLKGMIIYHCHEGIDKWCQGEWETDTAATERYKFNFENVERNCCIKFKLLQPDSGDVYMDMAEELAKNKLEP